MNPMRIALLLSLTGITTAHAYDLLNDPDRYAHPRSVEEYRAIIPEGADNYGMCRSAEHLAECLAEINGADVQAVKKSLSGLAIRRFR